MLKIPRWNDQMTKIIPKNYMYKNLKSTEIESSKMDLYEV